MCEFVFVGLPEAFVARAEGLLPPSLHLVPSQNAHLLTALPPSYSGFWVLSGGCSCGVWPRDLASSSADRYRRKGWSEAKTRRAYEQARQSFLAKHANDPPNALAAWVRSAVLASTLPVYLHEEWYAKDPDDVRLTVRGTAEVHADEHLSNRLVSSAMNRVIPLPVMNVPDERIRKHS